MIVLKEKTRESIKEMLAPFFESPTRVDFRELLKGCLGEFDHIDFKEKWIEIPDLAKHILAMANTCGGIIIFGVREQDNHLTPVGLSENGDKTQDKTKLKGSLEKFLPSNLDYDILDFFYDESEWGSLVGKSFQVVLVGDDPDKIPFLSNSDGSNIYKNRVYYRSKTNTEEANQQQIDDIIDRRIRSLHHIVSETKFSQDLSQLKQLYDLTSTV